ncbi:MAG TPA: NAD(P)-dependent oxidoreductase, partial [Arachidicoccus sp.]|nr:NAD(P)-dependent oxidoreductase [Arachidicoccus sp.]
LHLRLNAATVASVRKSDLAMMKPTAAIINTSRAELIEKGALVECLQQGRPGFAGLDVYESEPVYDPEFPLLKLPGVVCTPHLGYVEKQSYELYFGKAFENVMAFISGHPQNIANPEVLHRQ